MSVMFMLLQNSSLFNEFVRQKNPNLHTNELNTTFFFLFDEPLKGSKSLKIFKISLTFPDIYQNSFTQEKILKF
jgi:hypothetical protein